MVSRALASQPRAGAAWAGLFRREWARLRGHLQRRGAREDADDIAQDAFLRLWSAGHRARDARGFLYQIARNLLIDRHRRHKREGRAPFDALPAEPVDSAPSPEDSAHWRLRLEQVATLLDAMSEKRRAVLILRAVDGLSHAQIAERLSISTVAVEKHLLRAYALCVAWRAAEEAQARLSARPQAPVTRAPRP